MFCDAEDFRQAVVRALSLVDDAYTTEAVYRQLLGANWSESGIPAEWLEGLARHDMIEAPLCRLLTSETTRRRGGDENAPSVGSSETRR